MAEEEPVQRRIPRFWNTVAPAYDQDPANVPLPGTDGYATWLEAVGPLLLDAPGRVVDMGTGTGRVARMAAQQGHAVTGVDLAHAMLRVAQANTQRSGQPVWFALGDAVDPPFHPATFDAVISRSLIWTLREPETAFQNCGGY